jgi:hypothetical protein
VRIGLANIKSVLRSKKRRRKSTESEEMMAAGRPKVGTRPSGSSKREAQEQQIDDWVMNARTLGSEGLESVISLLRTARNEVVWIIGQ